MERVKPCERIDNNSEDSSIDQYKYILLLGADELNYVHIETLTSRGVT